MMQLHVRSGGRHSFFGVPTILPGYAPERTFVFEVLLLAGCFWRCLHRSAVHVPRAGASPRMSIMASTPREISCPLWAPLSLGSWP